MTVSAHFPAWRPPTRLWGWLVFLAIVAGVVGAGTAPDASRSASGADVVAVQQDFASDPGWDHYQNRIVGVAMPLVTQDFGWAPTNRLGGAPGEIGGRVGNSSVQAYYAMPLGRPLTFDDAISASGKLALHRIGLRGVGYIGFFNSQRHTWRVWSSMAFRIWEEDMLGQVMFDWMSSDWKARGAETAVLFSPDGKVHSWSFGYEPDARADPVWRDDALERHVTDQTGNGLPYELQGEEHLFERMRREEPTLTPESLHVRLLKARDQGLIEYFHRHDQHRWWKRDDAGEGHGRVTLAIDDHTPYVIWFDEQIRNAPVEFDRFGLFNINRFGDGVEIYLGDLVVNGFPVDLSQDPHWDGRGNRAQYRETTFHAMHDYGWSQTNWSGKAPGEIGGLFWRTEPQDPLFSYYADDVGELSLDDPIEFSGAICFTDGMTDAAAYFGYFNREEFTKKLGPENSDAGHPFPNMLGIAVSDLSAVGYYFSPLCVDARGNATHASGPVFTPSKLRRQFHVRYDPMANNGVGQLDITLDGTTFALQLTPDQRKAGLKLNRFGLANVRRGGHSVEFYLDDLTYTARRQSGTRPPFRKQTFVEAPYPLEQGGRRY